MTIASGGYTSTAATLIAGSATISIPAGSLAAGSDTLTASYTPDAASSPTYNGAAGTSSSVTVAKATPTVAVTPSSSSITTTQGLTVTVSVNGWKRHAYSNRHSDGHGRQLHLNRGHTHRRLGDHQHPSRVARCRL